MLNSVPLNVSFRRTLTGDNLVAWLKLVSTVINVNLSEEDDIFRWGCFFFGPINV